MEKTYRLIAFDMDGTLLDSKKEIRKDSLEAISEAVAHGKYAVLSTGRGICELTQYMSVLHDMKYFICESGAVLYDLENKTYMKRKTIKNSDCLEIIRRTENLDMMWHIHGDVSVLQKDQTMRIQRYHVEPYREMFRRICLTPDNMKSYIISENPSIYKFNCYCHNQQIRDRIIELTSDMHLSYSFSETTSVEFSSYGVSKASGLMELCSFLSIPVEQTIAVGDSDNDSAIMEAAGFAVAMGNANEHIKSIADAVVESNDSNGCAQAVLKYLL